MARMMIWKGGRTARSVSIIGITASLVIVPTGGQAGDHWLSRVTIETNNGFSSIASASVLASKSSAQGLFDITISLDSNPQGDDDYKVDNGTSDDAQNAYEKRIEEFAKAVYQSTNGVHKIRRVTIFRSTPGATRVASADVLWDENCASDNGPYAHPSGFGIVGKHIHMCTNWPGASTLMPTDKGGGYTLAHEWGHYAYGLYDEYAQEQCTTPACPEPTPRGTDTAAIPAIMNNQWVAASGTVPAGYSGSAADFLEFSTQNIHPYRSDSTGANAHKRVFGESAWQTLTRDSGTDPKFPWLPERTHYTNLAAPTDPNWIVRDNDSAALSELDIRWGGNQVMDMSIDVSGSMSGTPLTNAKTGANLLIDQLQAGSAIGVSSFATNVARNFPITNIPDPDTGVKVSAKAAVNALNTSGVTSLYDGLMFSLADLSGFDPNRPGLVYVLSDGGDNDSIATESDVIAAYQAAGVPIIAFAYGSFAPTGTLFRMASATGGAMYQSPTTAAQIQAALLAADARFSSNLLLSSAQAPVPSGSAITRTIPIDSSLASARITLTYNGSPTDFDFSLLLPNGADSGISFVCEGATSCSATLDEAFFAVHGYGDYQVSMNNRTGGQSDVTTLVSATPSGAETYDIEVGFSSNTISYPSDMAIRATVSKVAPITGVDVVATITKPGGSSFDITLLDDGKGSDQVANDGTYSASIPYSTNGIYSAVVTASNGAGKAKTTFEGVNVSLREDGTAVIPASSVIAENFVRVGTASTNIVAVTSDDHADDSSGNSCTGITDNNIDTAGRIDAAGDNDCFTFVPTSISNPIVVRATSLTAGMDPVLTIYDHTGTNQIAQANTSTSENPASGVIVTIPANKLDAAGLIFVVRHADLAAIVGGYAVSAGQGLRSDIINNPITPGPVPTQPTNKTPFANAGQDQTVTTGTLVTLHGELSIDPDNKPAALKYQWTQTAGPVATLTGADTENPSFTPSQAGTYTFSLVVNDGLASSVPATVNIVVTPSSANQTPTANAGPDQNVTVSDSVKLNGSGTDPDNGPSPLTFSWAQTGGPNVTLTGAGTATPSFSPTEAGDYSFTLVVNDGKDSSPADSVTIKVNPTSKPNQAPVADAGADQSATTDALVTLSGTGTDPDNGPSPLAFTWTQTSGPAVTLNGTNTATPSFTPTEAGDYGFSLVVSDGKDSSPADSVTVKVGAAPKPNQAPTANAGIDQTVTAGSVVTLNGSGTDPDNGPSPLTFAWTQTGGPAVTLTGSDTASPSFTPVVAGDYAFSLVANDGKDSSPADSVAITVQPVIVPPPANKEPVANAGPDQTVKLGATITLDGTGSNDPDQGPFALGYQWSQSGGPAQVALNGADSAHPGFRAVAVPGAYTFGLMVTDQAATSPVDEVTVNVEDTPVLLISPNGGEILKAKTLQTVRWYVSGTLAKTNKPLTIQLSKNGGKTWKLLKTVKPLAGSASWTPKATDASQQARLRVCVQAAGNDGKTVCDGSDQNFAIVK